MHDMVLIRNYIDLLNRYPNGSSEEDNIHVIQSIFPKQFGLPNIFTSSLKDYRCLDDEIKKKNKGKLPNVPKRLLETPKKLVAKLQKLQKQCSYSALVRYYCPVFVRLYYPYPC